MFFSAVSIFLPPIPPSSANISNLETLLPPLSVAGVVCEQPLTKQSEIIKIFNTL